MKGPFVAIAVAELPRLAELPKRDLLVLIALRALCRNGWATRRRELERLTGYSARHVKLALAALAARGIIAREFSGTLNDPWGRFRVTFERDLGDPSSRDLGDPTTGISAIPEWDRGDPSTPPDPDPFQIPPSRSEPEGGRDGLVELVQKLWPTVAGRVAARYCAQLRELAPAAIDSELRSYLRAAAVDATLEGVRLPIAVACTPDRVNAWTRRRSRRLRPPPAPAPAGDLLSPRELAELGAQALLEL